jgi:hypothetical protein
MDHGVLIMVFNISNADKMDNLIYSIAKENSQDDRDELFKVMVESELFSPIENANPDEKISLQVVNVEGNRMTLFYTEKESLEGKGKIAGMKGLNALEMILGSKRGDGILLQSLKKNTWFAMSKPMIEELLINYRR